MGITGARWRRAGYPEAMSHDQSRTDANSRERSPDHEYTLSIEETADLYAKVGHPRTPRAIQMSIGAQI